MATPEKTFYLTNKEFLSEIHKSKCTYCCFDDPKYSDYDVIIRDLAELTPELMLEAKEKRAARLTAALRTQLRDEGCKPTEIKAAEVTVESISDEDVVIRQMTIDHIPLDPDRKRRGRITEASAHAKVPFASFKHLILKDGEFVEVGRSHWKGKTVATGEFEPNGGKMTNRLAHMFMLLVERYSRKSNWRGYSYVEEMKGHALLQLSQIGLQFDESKSDNPFSFYTTAVTNCFTRILNLEKRNQNIRDDLLVMYGASPSNTRQNDHEFTQGLNRFNSASDTDTSAPPDESSDQPE